MRYYIAFVLIISYVLFSKEGLARDSNVPSGIFLSCNLGLGRYENLTMTDNHPPTPVNLRGCSKLFGAGATLTFFRLNTEINWLENSVSQSADSVIGTHENCLEIKGGIHILPSNWPVQLIPEIGYFSIKEDVRMFPREEKEVILYKEDFEDKGTLFGGSGIWKINSSNFLKFSYSNNNLKQIGIDNYLLQWRFYFPSPIKELRYKQVYYGFLDFDYCVFFDFKIGISTKTDGRKSCYCTVGLGLDPIKMFAYDSYKRKTKGSK
ncbi:hypothetical protein KAW50_04545 [candidate division WOR-3 bacterium]|nr:hypothetical protein [candidate division WOR-3 bacterium]